MKQKTKLIISLALFAVLLIGAALAYNILGDNFAPQTQLATTQNSESTAQSQSTQTQQEEQPQQEEVQSQSTQTQQAEEEQAEQTENKALDFIVYDEEGEQVKLSDFYGKPIVLNFWASWCPPCKEEMPYFETVNSEYGQDVQFLMVNMVGSRADETEHVASDFITQSGYTFPVFYDTNQDAAYTYGVYSLPTTYFIDENANIIAGAQGSISEEMLREGVSLIYDIPQENTRNAQENNSEEQNEG